MSDVICTKKIKQSSYCRTCWTISESEKNPKQHISKWRRLKNVWERELQNNKFKFLLRLIRGAFMKHFLHRTENKNWAKHLIKKITFFWGFSPSSFLRMKKVNKNLIWPLPSVTPLDKLGISSFYVKFLWLVYNIFLLSIFFSLYQESKTTVCNFIFMPTIEPWTPHRQWFIGMATH